NGSLNVLHFGWAFVVQYGTGLILEQWTPEDGHYPAIAYQVAFAVSVAVQIVALAWFAVPWLRSVDWRAPASFLRDLAGDKLSGEPIVASTEICMFEPHESGEW
ncbi:MAG TPA: hypothetical protein VJ846_03010, partial [Sphingomicrobium sp.]|nr:hypothetical protein [Sphingomicrobium sp.]